MYKFLLITSLLFIYKCSYAQTDSVPIEIRTQIFDTSSSEMPTDVAEKQYFIKITLVNKTSLPIQYCVYSCSWEDNFTFNTNKIELISSGCDVNCPNLIKIEAGKTAWY